MPKIPTYGSPQVAPQLPGNPMSGSGNTGPSGMEYLGEGLKKLGQALQQRENQQDNLVLEDNWTQARNEQQKLKTEYFSKEKRQLLEPDPNGDDPNIDLRESINQRYKDFVHAQAAELPDRLRQKYLLNAYRFGSELDYSTNDYYVNQKKKVDDDINFNADGQEQKILRDSVWTPDGQIDWPSAYQSMQRRIAVAKANATARGEDINVAEANAITDSHAILIQGSLDRGNTTEAASLFSQFKHNMNDKARSTLEKSIDNQSDFNFGKRISSELIVKNQIAGTNNFNIYDAYRDLNQMNLSKARNDAAMAQLNTAYSLIRQSEGEVMSATNNAVFSIYNQTGSVDKAVNSNQFRQYLATDPIKARQLQQTITNFHNWKIAEQLGQYDPGRWVKNQVTLNYFKYNQDLVKSMDLNAISNPALMNDLGEKNYSELKNYWETLRTPDGQRKIVDVVIPKEELDKMLTAAGLDVKPKGEKKIHEWQLKQLNLMQQAEDLIRAKQVKEGRQLLQTERAEVVKPLITKFQTSKPRELMGLPYWWPETVEKYGYELATPQPQTQVIPAGRQPQTPPVQATPSNQPPPVITISPETATLLNEEMVSRGMLSNLKPGETVTGDRLEKVKQYAAVRRVPGYEQNFIDEQARKTGVMLPTAVPPSAVTAPMITAPAVSTPPQATPAKPQSKIAKTLENVGRRTGFTQVVSAIAKPPLVLTKRIANLIGIKYTDQVKADYDNAIKEMTQSGIFKPNQQLSNKDWDNIKAYIARKKGNK